MTTRQQGKIGRAELFSLALAICLSGFILFGWAEKQYQQQAWLYWGVACCFGLVFWLVLWGWAHIFAGQSFAEALCYAFGRGGGRVLLLLYAVFWLLLPAGSTVCAVLFWQRLGGETASFALYAALFLLSSACFAATGALHLPFQALDPAQQIGVPGLEGIDLKDVGLDEVGVVGAVETGVSLVDEDAGAVQTLFQGAELPFPYALPPAAEEKDFFALGLHHGSASFPVGPVLTELYAYFGQI